MSASQPAAVTHSHGGHEHSHAPAELARERLRTVGLRVTPQRLAVLEILEAAPHEHLSADDVWRRLDDAAHPLDRSTAYRVLADLTGAGILQQAQLGDGAARFEVRAEPHHHAVCVVCGATEDVRPDSIEVLARRLREMSGFALGSEPLLLSGRCARCQESIAAS